MRDAKQCPRKTQRKTQRKPARKPAREHGMPWSRAAAAHPAWAAGVVAVLAQVHPGSTLRSSGSAALSDYLGHIADTILAAAGKGEITIPAMKKACNAVLAGQLMQHAQEEVRKALRDEARMPFAWEDTQELAAAAGVEVSEDAARVLATTLEYLCAEVLELAGNAAGPDLVLTATHIHAVFAQDPELGATLGQLR
jgi:hypothetical protein